jgi:hypothetical protein
VGRDPFGLSQFDPWLGNSGRFSNLRAFATPLKNLKNQFILSAPLNEGILTEDSRK